MNGDVDWHANPETMPSRAEGYTGYDQCRRLEHTEGWHLPDCGGMISFDGTEAVWDSRWEDEYDRLMALGEIDAEGS